MTCRSFLLILLWRKRFGVEGLTLLQRRQNVAELSYNWSTGLSVGVLAETSRILRDRCAGRFQGRPPVREKTLRFKDVKLYWLSQRDRTTDGDIFTFTASPKHQDLGAEWVGSTHTILRVLRVFISYLETSMPPQGHGDDGEDDEDDEGEGVFTLIFQLQVTWCHVRQSAVFSVTSCFLFPETDASIRLYSQTISGQKEERKPLQLCVCVCVSHFLCTCFPLQPWCLLQPAGFTSDFWLV